MHDALDFYYEFRQMLDMLVNDGIPLDTPLEDDETLGEAIERVRLHIHRLETNHADCVTPCCTNCRANLA